MTFKSVTQSNKTHWLAMYFVALNLLSVPAFSQKPDLGIGNPPPKISLQAYSFSKELNDKVRGRGEGMSLSDLIDYCATNNFDAVDLTAYYFPGYPQVPPDSYIYSLKKKAYNLGIDICCTGVKNDFANLDPQKRAADVQLVKEWIDVAVKLGAPMIRIFSGNIPVGYENKWDSIAGYMTKSIKECVEYGKKNGVLIGIQNHGDFLKTADETIALIKLVDSDWCGIIVDSGYFLTSDPYVDMQKTMPYAVNFLLKESPFGKNSSVKIDLKRVMKIISNSGYRGYISLETLSPKKKKSTSESTEKDQYDPHVEVAAFLKEVRNAQKEEFRL